MFWIFRKLEQFIDSLRIERKQISPCNCDSLLLAGVSADHEFDLDNFLCENSPHLVFFYEFLERQFALYQLDPRMMLAILQFQSGLVLNYRQLEQLDKPFGNLSQLFGFENQVTDVSQRIVDILRGDYSDDQASCLLMQKLRFILVDDLQALDFGEVLERFRLHSIYYEMFACCFNDPEQLYARIFELSSEQMPETVEERVETFESARKRMPRRILF